MLQPGFLKSFDREFTNEASKKNKKLSGSKMLEAFQKSRKDTGNMYHSCFLFLAIEQKTGGLVYLNLDSLVG